MPTNRSTHTLIDSKVYCWKSSTRSPGAIPRLREEGGGVLATPQTTRNTLLFLNAARVLHLLGQIPAFDAATVTSTGLTLQKARLAAEQEAATLHWKACAVFRTGLGVVVGLSGLYTIGKDPGLTQLDFSSKCNALRRKTVPSDASFARKKS